MSEVTVILRNHGLVKNRFGTELGATGEQTEYEAAVGVSARLLRT